MTASTTHIDDVRKKAAKAKKGDEKGGRRKQLGAHSRVGGSFAFYAVLAGVLILAGVGLLMVVSASSGETVINQVSKSAATLAKQGKLAGLASIKTNIMGVGVKQLVSLLLGCALAWAISRMNYRKYSNSQAAIAMGAIVLLLLIVVPIFGVEVNNAKRWIVVFGQSLQPSEFAKPVLLILITAAMYKVHQRGHDHIRDRDIWIIPGIIAFASLVLILKQPETGNVIIIMVGLLAAYLILELPLKPLGVILIGVAVVAAIAIAQTPYRLKRILVFLNLADQGNGAKWQVTQAKLAFGSGGLTGLGPGLSRQKYFYLPEAQNDFILAIIGEELGIPGSIAVLGGFALVLWGGFKIAYEATDSFGRALAGGALTMLMTQAILNIFSVIGLGPVTGKPLPFVTLGGSAMITSFALLGIILSVARFGKQPEPKCVGAGRNDTTRSATVKSKNKLDAKRERGVKNKPTGKTKTGTRRTKHTEEEDEDSLEWRWDGGSHLPGSRTRR
ncbi:MAG: FtsW/RodA/SpoVE family cell cycle protein [Coriobacteriia bacterium]|nr:FtsW/RodA/SpoVE family cell cycle protein [Coriobacteriia bacterium]